jgi:sporulation protein YqfC
MPVRRSSSEKNKKSKEEKHSFKEKMAEVLELPKEIVMNFPKITMIGNGDLLIENYKGIIEYEEAKIRVNTGSGIIKILGEHLMIKEITSENILIDGKISLLEFN